MSVLAVRMSDDMKQHLDYIASHFQRSKNFIAVDALKDYIASKMIEIEDEKDYREALRRSQDKSIPAYSGDEVRAFLKAQREKRKLNNV